jgi:hypothetical protein
MRYFKRFRPNGEPFYIDEAGELVQESLAQTNLVQSAGAQVFEETSWFNEPETESKDRIARAGRRRVSVNARENMEEAFSRHLFTGYTRAGGVLSEEEDSTPEPKSEMEEAFARMLSSARNQ